MISPLDSAKKALNYEIEALKEAVNNLDDNFTKAVELILKSSGRLIVSGMGKSGLIGNKISATLSSTGTPSLFLHPAEALHGDLGMVTEDDIVLLLSNSGETDEIIRIVPFIRRIGAKIIAMVGNLDSSLAKNSDIVINSFVSREACPLNLAPTSSTTVSLALGDALACALIEARGFKEKDFARFHPSGSLGRKFIAVKDLMHSGDSIPLVAPNEILREAVVKMSHGGFGALVITGNDHKLLGVFTDGDLRRFFEKSKEVDLDIPISNVMTANPKRVTATRLAM
ncbi:MAG: KpsF/GutQ family sugar-phosphate isomerase, partial [Candidatus Riflebacteria bacterium]|nr:KpsF/GutQ family sugar-phosphate isomerase [Candidatus Riflebacteria bacterium]